MIYRNIGPLDPCNLESSWANLLTGLTKNSQSNLDAFWGTGLLSQNWDIPNIHGGKQMCHKPKITLRLGHLFALSQHKRHKMKIHLQVGCAIDSDICCLYTQCTLTPSASYFICSTYAVSPQKSDMTKLCVYFVYGFSPMSLWKKSILPYWVTDGFENSVVALASPCVQCSYSWGKHNKSACEFLQAESSWAAYTCQCQRGDTM